jgi:hypothetical protein
MDLPGTGWHPIKTHQGTLFVRGEDLAAAHRDAMLPQFAVSVSVFHTDNQELQAFAESLIDPRIGPGAQTTLSGVPALSYEFTDGIALLRSFLAIGPRGGIVEVRLRSRFLDSGEPVVSLDSASEEVLPSLCWTDVRLDETTVSDWAVFRQDDNGIVAPVAIVATRLAAEKLVADFEARGHKQTYWFEQQNRTS